jgi:predicted aconitase with swiveling domain
MKLRGRKIVGGKAEGEVIVSRKPLSFLGGVDPETGIVTDAESDIRGQSIAGKILVFPRGKGSTVGSYIVYALKKNNKAPKAIIVGEAETIVATGAIIASIPMIDGVDVSKLKTGMKVRVDADSGEVEILEE